MSWVVLTYVLLVPLLVAALILPWLIHLVFDLVLAHALPGLVVAALVVGALVVASSQRVHTTRGLRLRRRHRRRNIRSIFHKRIKKASSIRTRPRLPRVKVLRITIPRTGTRVLPFGGHERGGRRVVPGV